MTELNPGTSTVARKMENKQLKKVNYIDMLESLPTVTVAMKLKDDPWKNCYSKPRQHIKQRHYVADKGAYNQSYGFFSSHVPPEPGLPGVLVLCEASYPLTPARGRTAAPGRAGPAARGRRRWRRGPCGPPRRRGPRPPARRG